MVELAPASSRINQSTKHAYLCSVVIPGTLSNIQNASGNPSPRVKPVINQANISQIRLNHQPIRMK